MFNFYWKHALCPRKQFTLLLQISTLWKLRPQTIPGSAPCYPACWWHPRLGFLILTPRLCSFQPVVPPPFLSKNLLPSNKQLMISIFFLFKMWSGNQPHRYPQQNVQMQVLRPHPKPIESICILTQFPEESNANWNLWCTKSQAGLWHLIDGYIFRIDFQALQDWKTIHCAYVFISTHKSVDYSLI